MISKFIKKEKGYVAFFVTILVLSALSGIAISIVILTLSIQKISANIIKSSQAYYAAEAGIEDSLLRIFDPSVGGYLSSNTLSVGGATATITIEKVSTSLTIESQGNASERIRKLKVKAFITSSEASFYYGVQVGDGGLIMNGNSKILGNVYSNGPVVGSGNTEIRGDLYVAKATGFIDSMNVIKTGTEDGNAHAHTILNSDIENGAYYYDDTTISATAAGSYYPGSPDPEPEDLPISEVQINKWKDDAIVGGTMGSYILNGGSDSLGPIKINGDLTINSNSILTQTGTIWVTGDFYLNSNTVIQLAGSYGSNSGVIIVDGNISLSSNVVICGAEGYKPVGSTCYENIGSFLMFVSNSFSGDPSSPAIWANSNSNAAILYTNNGLIRLGAAARLKEVTGYALYIDSNSTITYESGLANINFTSGPGGGWKIDSWKEVE